MIEKRKHRRIDCATKCILYHDGSKFRGVVENLSISGALLRIRRNLSGIIHPGDACSLLICHLPVLSYSRHASQVKHLDSTAIGIQFHFIEDELRPPLEQITRQSLNTSSEEPAAEREFTRISAVSR